jgi:hypothetical protein
MNVFKRAAVRAAIGGMAVAAVAAVSPAASQADTSPVSDSITITPDPTVTAGSSVTISASATNNTSSTIAGSLGIQISDPALLHDTNVSAGARNVGGKLIYKGDTQWAPGQTITITLTATAVAAGTENFSVYSAGTGSASDVWAYDTLTINS